MCFVYMSFGKRIKEHMHALRVEDNRCSQYASHLKDNNHTFNVNNATSTSRILHQESNNRPLLNLEVLNIHKLQDNTNKIMLNQQNNFEISKLKNV